MTMNFAGAHAAAWVAAAAQQARPTPTPEAQLPAAFESYARLFHPAVDFDGQPVRWAEIARTRGATFHAGAQFDALAGIDENGFALADDAWEGDPPRADGLPLSDLSALTDVLEEQTESAELYFALWTGYAFAGGENDGARMILSPAERADVLTLGEGGYQQYWVFSGTFADLRNPVWAESERTAERRAPDLVWPADRSWFVSTELFEDSTILGGSAELIAAVVAASAGERGAVEALRLEAGTRLDRDEVNPRDAHTAGGEAAE
ncbi:hypothetical protein [Zhihengliuella flava]|uniref:Uncharacterized protein n=1 Tax=Zhihengliuella flava TaxID=1285193 RepID=A0A931D8H8_9MICC|nr:hypothetical protein [Zhihengliuella flava]MBG6085600.1 hypothetical protein [Zhihengliuella flava]